MNVEAVDIKTVHRHLKLQKFIDESKARLRAIVKRLEWNTETVIVPGPVEVNETQEANSEPAFPPSYANGNSITTDVAELRKVVSDADIAAPEKFSDLQLNFTRQQKLAIYEHVVANTEKCPEPEATVPALGGGSLTFAEIVAQKKRETKKRRRYRQSKPTHLEEVRAVVDLQMQALQQYLNAKATEERKLAPRIFERHKHRTDGEHDGAGRHKRQLSRSRSHGRKSSKKRRNTSRSTARSHKQEKRLHKPSSSKNRKKHKYRSRSCSKSVERKRHKRRSRSNEKSHKRRDKSVELRTHKRESEITERKRHKRRSRSRSRGRSRSRHRNKVHYRNSENHLKHKVSSQPT